MERQRGRLEWGNILGHSKFELEGGMKRRVVLTCLFAIVAMSYIVGLPASTCAEPLTINIKISPNTLAMDAETVWLTVHTDIALSAVDTTSIEIDGLAVSWTKADARGNLVAKFDINEVKSMVAPGEVVLTLTGVRNDGVAFMGSDAIVVKDIDPGR